MAERLVPGTSLTVRLNPPTPGAICAVVFDDHHPRRDGQKHRVENPPIVAVYVQDQQIRIGWAAGLLQHLGDSRRLGRCIDNLDAAGRDVSRVPSPFRVRFDPNTGPTRLNETSCTVFLPVRGADLH